MNLTWFSDILDPVGELVVNAGDAIGTVLGATHDPYAAQAASDLAKAQAELAAKKTDYTPLYIGGGIALAVVAIFFIMKK